MSERRQISTIDHAVGAKILSTAATTSATAMNACNPVAGHSFNVLPRLGKLVAHDEASYRYLAESIRVHPDQPSLKAMMEAAGFERVEWFNLTAGVVAVHRGYVF